MAEFLTSLCQGPLDGPHLIPVVRGLTLACFERALRDRGAADRELERFRWQGLGKYLTDEETARFYIETPEIDVAGFRLFFKAYSESFQPFERIMAWFGNRGPWGVAIRVGMKKAGSAAGGAASEPRRFTCTTIALGLLHWTNPTPPLEELNNLQIRLDEAWAATGIVPHLLSSDAAGDRPIVGCAWRVEEWNGRTDELVELAGRLLAAAMALLPVERGRAFDPSQHGALEGDSRMNAAEKLSGYLASKGYRYAPEQIATFYAALKAKGFVILSGLSGTGKTKLAQEFAHAVLPDREGNLLLEPVRPDWRDSTGLLGYWNPVTRNYEATRFLRHVLNAAADYRGEAGTVTEEGLSQWLRQNLSSVQWATRVRRYREALQRVQHWRGAWTTEQLSFLWRERDNGIRLVRGELTADDEVLRRATELLSDQRYSLAHRINEALTYLRRTGEPRIQRVQVVRAAAALEPQAVLPLVVRGTLRRAARALGLRVVVHREPEPQRWTETETAWRLLNEAIRPILAGIGENPDDSALRATAIELASKYTPGGEVAPLRSEAESDDDDEPAQAEPHFVILDEMNLARVEYYLAEVLSVLESGRISDGPEAGFTRGEISLHGQDDQVRLPDGTVVPPTLRLPPNLYIIGTVNMDETTFSFSPKVLDRAFTMEFRGVDLDGYPPEVGDADPAQPDLSLTELLDDFTRHGRFAWFSKADVAGWARSRRGLVAELQQLNVALLEHDLGFGYRVVDEILAFVGGVAESPVGAALPETLAFDAAVMMKVLPKFHGPLHRVEKPLRAVLTWAGEGEEVRYPRTSGKAARMLRQAVETGHTSFS